MRVYWRAVIFLEDLALWVRRISRLRPRCETCGGPVERGWRDFLCNKCDEALDRWALRRLSILIEGGRPEVGMKQLEAAILKELREVSGNKKLRQKDIMEWQTGNTLKAQDGETLYYLPQLQVSVCVKVQ